MRCLTAEVNGSGRLTRWDFNADGEVQAVELADGVQRVPSDAHTIGFDFGKEGGMAP
jgi:YD repeat-containing protein